MYIDEMYIWSSTSHTHPTKKKNWSRPPDKLDPADVDEMHIDEMYILSSTSHTNPKKKKSLISTS